MLQSSDTAQRAMGGALLPAERAVFVKAFYGECAALAAAHHPNILGFVGLVMNDNMATVEPLYMATQLVEGGTLSDLCYGDRYAHLRAERSSLPFDIIVDATYQLFLGLDYLHTRQPAVLHCDIKPQNVLVESDGPSIRCIIADLGESISHRC